jgi:hypothetical protein
MDVLCDGVAALDVASGRVMQPAPASRPADARTLAEWTQGGRHARPRALREALPGRYRPHRAFLLGRKPPASETEGFVGVATSSPMEGPRIH